MAQIFPQSANKLPLLVAVAALVLPPVAVGGVWYYFSPRFTDVGYQPIQPVPYSHKLHAGDMQIDCRYCHASVEVSAYAGMPPTKTCMNCHQQIWVGSETLAPVRESYRTGTPIRWERVHRLAEFAYFNHSVHVNKGVGCTTCHGPIGHMPLVWQHGSLLMEWCLECHREPEKFLRPRDRVFDTQYQAPPDQAALGRELAQAYDVKSLIHCSTCHR